MNLLEANSKTRKNSGIPKLDLSKAKKIQFLNIKKIEKMNEQPTKSSEVSDKISKYLRINCFFFEILN